MSEKSRTTVILHVGAPKTGTSYVQHVLFTNQRALRHQHVLYPGDRFDAHFLAALDLMQLTWGGLEKDAVGAWDRLADEARGYAGTVVVSHEILATASRAQVARALASFEGAEVHVVYSARDLVRQIPAEWQETVKHRRIVSYHSFLKRLQDPQRRGRLAAWFWGVQDIPDVLDRWAATLPPERVHLVTVPPPGAPRGLLWERFRTVFGVDDSELEMDGGRANPSLGVPETALVRRVNEQVNDVVPNHHYRELVRELLSHNTLSARTDTPRLALPADVRAWAAELSSTWIDTIRERGYDVVGDLDELRAGIEVAFTDPDEPDEAAVASAAVAAIGALVKEAARLRDVEDELRGEVDELKAALDRSYLRPSYKLREKAVKAANRNPAGRKALDAYRVARGRSSRSE